ncbi:YTH domain-containing family protein [Oopsacas minuta]|uniref:YTH domain-containing family protein n=1 Tax=Oopsacas minuta TaxID=111878 RepID=A0AAV7JJM3_9METZ|nr:YTH domain-containing family protein [Oopsacas minuta]
MSNSTKSQLESRASRRIRSGASEPSSPPQNSSSPSRSSKESSPDSTHNNADITYHRYCYNSQEQYCYPQDIMNRSPYYYSGSHHSSMESLASQDSIQQMMPPYAQQFLIPGPHYFYSPQPYGDGIFTLEPIMHGPQFSVQGDTQMYAATPQMISPQVIIPEMSPHYEMQPLMVPVHPEFQHDPSRTYHITQAPEGTIDPGYSEIPLRVGYYTQPTGGDVQDIYRHSINSGNHWSSPTNSHRERQTNNRREKRSGSADSSYSGAHSDNNQMYSSRYTRRSRESSNQSNSSDLLARLKRHFNPKTLDGFPLKDARFFVIKSYSEQDIRQSIRHEIWTSTESGNKRLDNAFREQRDRPIYLFFSVNASGHFCGIAEMVSEVDLYTHTGIFSQEKWKGKFRVKWIFIKDIPNQHLRRVKLSNNEGKPITNSRDCQEVLYEQGVDTMRLILEYASSTCMLDDLDYADLSDEMKRIGKKERYSSGTK